jgi:hypothetical protein
VFPTFDLFFSAGAVLALAGLVVYILALVTREEYVDPPYVPRHARSDADILAMLDFETAVMLDDAYYIKPVSLGRHGMESPVRNEPVQPEWAPPVGGIRIALLDTPTAEYLFARKPKDQLNVARFVRSYTVAS